MKLLIQFILVVLVLSAMKSFASEGSVISNANKNDIRYIKNNKRLPDVVFQAELREQANWKNFMNKNGTWYVIFNEENRLPHRAFGEPIPTYGMDAQSRAMNFITTKLNGYRLPLADIEYRTTTQSENFKYIHFNQKYNGLKVLDADLYIKMTPNGSVITFGCDVYNDITISTSPAIASSAAIQDAKKGITDNVTASSISNELFILPIPDNKLISYHLVYEVTIETIDDAGVPAKYYTLVDANTGEILYRENKVMHFDDKKTAKKLPPSNTDIFIEGTVYPTHLYNPSAVMPLRNLKMVNAGTPYNSDATGFIGLTNTSSTYVTFTLEGLWSKVKTGTTTPSYTATVNPGTNTLSFNANANIRQLSAYYHVNIVHDYMKTKFPAFTDMDNPLQTNVDVAGTCNAFYSGTSINFYATGGGCSSLAQVGDVVYHEYGHGINDKFYSSQGGNFGNGGMNEGYADVWAMGITNNPVLGIGFNSTDPTVFIRRYDINKKVFPQNLVGEVHADGEIIAGCWWDTGLNMGNTQQMMDLYKETFFATVTGPNGTEGQVYVDVLIEALNADDVPANGGDNNISNGTPNDNAIVNGFDTHGITLLSNAVLTHVPVETAAANNGITINSTVTVTYPWALANVKMFYKINKNGSWSSTIMNNTSANNYAGTIPSQPSSTVVGYYLALEHTNGSLSITRPIGANLVNGNIPYFILTGATLLAEEDFDINTGSWTQGIPADGATTGIWTIDIPTGSFIDPLDPGTVVQPDVQHTLNGQYCAVTGNAPNATDNIGTNDVDAGATTLESPVYNLSSYSEPIFSYQRWYVNNVGANPANDHWKVHISNDGTTWVPVEWTNFSDRSWRKFAFRVKDYIALSSTVSIRFTAEDSLIVGANLSGGSIVEAGLDDLYLYESDAVGINEESSIAAISVFPNPANNHITVALDVTISENFKLELYNTLGEIVYAQNLNNLSTGNHRIHINTQSINAGMYMLSVKSEKYNKEKKVTIIK